LQVIIQAWRRGPRRLGRWVCGAFVCLLFLEGASGLPTGYQDLPIGHSWPRSIGINPITNKIYLTTTSGIYPPTGFTLTVVNASSRTISLVIPFQGIPGELAVNPNTDQVYVINGSSIAIFDGASGDETGNIRFKAPLYAVVVDPVTGRLFATSADTLFELSLYPHGEMKSFPVGSYAVGLAVNTATNMVYAANYLSNTVSVFNATKESLVGTIDLGPQSINPSELAVNPTTNKVYVTTGRNSVVVIDGLTDRVTRTLQVGTSPGTNSTYALAVDPTKNQVYVATTPSPLLTIIDGGTDTIVGTLRINYSPYKLAVDPVNSRLYVTDYHLLTVVEVGELSSSQQNTALELIGAITFAILLASLLLWRRSRRGLRRGRSRRDVIPSDERPDVLPSRLRKSPSFWPSSCRQPR
jgi:DNA-binding beta-propeller fold protein YncE